MLQNGGLLKDDSNKALVCILKACEAHLEAEDLNYENTGSPIKNGWKETCKIHFKYQNKGM